MSILLMPITTFLFSVVALYVAGIGPDETLVRLVLRDTTLHWRRIYTGSSMYAVVVVAGFLSASLQHIIDAFIKQYQVIDAMGYHLYAYLLVSAVAVLALSFPVTLVIYPIGRRLEARIEEENREKDLWR